MPTSLLLPQVVDAVDIPVLGAGGFPDGRGLVAALAWGASGIAMGTRFLLTEDSTVPDAVKQIYLGDVGHRHRGHHRDRRVPPAGGAHRRGRRARAGVGRHPAAQARAPAPCEFRKLTGTSYRDLLTEGLAMKRNQDLTLERSWRWPPTPRC